MSIRLRRPDEDVLRQLLIDAAGDALTYSPVGMSRATGRPPGYRVDSWVQELGDAPHVWEQAREALSSWQAHRGAGLVVCADGPPALGVNVAMSAPLPIAHIDAVCRVVSIDDRPDRFGFTYGTLSNHPEQGEESFTVMRSPSGHVRFEIVAASRPHHILAKTAAPIARLLQRRTTERYLGAMARATAIAQ